MSNRPTTIQLEALVEFLEQHPAIARGFLRTALGKQESKRKWAEIAMSLNSLGGVIKDGPAWAKYWAEKKCSLKKQCAQNAASIRQTGGGIGYTTILSELDRRLVAVMGGTSFASGDSELAVNPFPIMHSVAVAEAEIPSTSLGDIGMLASNISSVPNIIEHIHSPLLPLTHEEHNEIRVEAPAAVPPPSNSPGANRTRQRLRRTRSSNFNTEIERMASIEERRVEAERLSAQAFADIGQKLDRIAEANNNIAVAITAVANALQQIANKMAP
ncbi:hypothetical protein ACJJTC_019271 [Scirpophaga incertulas]